MSYRVDPHSLPTLILPSHSSPSPHLIPSHRRRRKLTQLPMMHGLSYKTWMCTVVIIWRNWEAHSVEHMLTTPTICFIWEHLTNIGRCGFVEAHSCIGWIEQVRMRNTAAWRIGHKTSVPQNSERFGTQASKILQSCKQLTVVVPKCPPPTHPYCSMLIYFLLGSLVGIMISFLLQVELAWHTHWISISQPQWAYGLPELRGPRADEKAGPGCPWSESSSPKLEWDDLYMQQLACTEEADTYAQTSALWLFLTSRLQTQLGYVGSSV